MSLYLYESVVSYNRFFCRSNKNEREFYMKRREFLRSAGSAALISGMTILADPRSVRATPANDKIRVAFAGCGGRCEGLLLDFLAQEDVAVTAFYDPMKNRAQGRAKIASEKGQKPIVTDSLSELLDSPEVDAVVSATPDHWHALITVLACQAGKDVYIEKPASQSAWEGQKMIEAARKYQRVVQLGTQNRSGRYNIAARQYIADGKLGKIHCVRVVNMKDWGNFPMEPTRAVPEGFDWNTWLGPAPMRDYSPTYFSGWHHFWDFSSGDIINDAIHQIDLARMIIGKELPKSAYSVGGRFNQKGACETPDTQTAVFEYDDLIFNFELTLYTPYMLKIDPKVRANDMFPYWPQCATRIEIYGDQGMMQVGRHGGGWQVFDRPKSRQPVVKAQDYGRFPQVEHIRNFLDCVKSRALPNADIEIGHKSTLLAHLATISYRLGGQKLDVNPDDGSILNCPEAAPYWKRTYREDFAVPEEV